MRRIPVGSGSRPCSSSLWANMHGSFVLAPAILGYAWLDDVLRGRPARTSFAVLVLGVLATFVTPFGPGVWAYAAGIGANPVIAGQVSEWQRTTPFTVTGLLFYASVAAVAVAMALRAVRAVARRLGRSSPGSWRSAHGRSAASRGGRSARCCSWPRRCR